MSVKRFDVVIAGAGAAGLMCALEAGKRGRSVVALDHCREPGRKILISGGGRCNFTNRECRPDHYVSANPHFVKSALARYPPRAFIALVEKHGIPYCEKKDGQLFCDRSARDIQNMLLKECASAGVRLLCGCRIQSVRRADEFEILTSAGVLRAQSFVVATGGLSVPKAGATDVGYRIARQFGHAVVACRPALVPLLFSEADRSRLGDLAGISLEVSVSCGKHRFQDRMLFTHRGLSGPAILQISLHWEPGALITIDLLPGTDLLSELLQRKAAGDRTTVKSIVARKLPARFAERWFQLWGGGSSPVAAVAHRELERLATALRHWEIQPAGSEGYAKAEVTRGGVDTRALSSKTMESRNIPGLYFIGEVLDVTGQLGGFNLQWAWASGYAAGQAV